MARTKQTAHKATGGKAPCKQLVTSRKSAGGKVPKITKTSRKSVGHKEPRKSAYVPNDGRIHLPAPVWGHVLDYLPYKDVLTSLLVCKMMAKEAVQYVQTLTVNRSSEMYVPAARRFKNVTEVKVLCLLDLLVVEPTPEDFGLDDDESFDEDPSYLERFLNADAMWRVIPFLSAFKKLERTVLGAYLKDRYDQLRYNGGESIVIYDEREFQLLRTTGPENHGILFLAFIDSFIAAIKSGLLPSNLKSTKGLINTFGHCSDDSASNRCKAISGDCCRCYDICKYLPFEDACDAELCFADVSIYEILKERKGGLVFMKTKTEEVLLDVLKYYRNIRSYWSGGIWIYSWEDHVFDLLDELIKVGFVPADIPKESIWKALENYTEEDSMGDSDDEEESRFAQSSLSKLESRGFDMSEFQRLAIDESQHPKRPS